MKPYQPSAGPAGTSTASSAHRVPPPLLRRVTRTFFAWEGGVNGRVCCQVPVFSSFSVTTDFSSRELPKASVYSTSNTASAFLVEFLVLTVRVYFTLDEIPETSWARLPPLPMAALPLPSVACSVEAAASPSAVQPSSPSSKLPFAKKLLTGSGEVWEG